MLAVEPTMDGDFPPHELPPPGGGIQLQVSLVLILITTPGDTEDALMAMTTFVARLQSPAPQLTVDTLDTVLSLSEKEVDFDPGLQHPLESPAHSWQQRGFCLFVLLLFCF